MSAKFEPAKVGETVSLLVPSETGMQTGEYGWHMRITRHFKVLEANDEYFVVEGGIKIDQKTGAQIHG